MKTAPDNKELRKLPSVEKILTAAEIQPEINRYSRALVTHTAQDVLVEARRQIGEGAGCPPIADIYSNIKELLNRQWPAFLSPVINGTGIIIHTNLGRAPLSRDALEALAQIGSNFCPLEYDLPGGKRGRSSRFPGAYLAGLPLPFSPTLAHRPHHRQDARPDRFG